MAQTAVEWLEWLFKEGILIEKSFEIAKQKEKEQIEMAYQADRYPCSDEDAQQYYKETYNK
jgi:hypothetical protein